LHDKGWKFYEFIAGGGCRFMCAWDTTEDAVDALLADMQAVLSC
jgi:threonine aldolase